VEYLSLENFGSLRIYLKLVKFFKIWYRIELKLQLFNMKKIISTLGIATILTLGLNFPQVQHNQVIAQETEEIEALIRLCDWSNGELALEACDKLLEIDPGFNKARIEKGLALIWLEKYSEAQAYFDEILDQPIDLILLTKSFNKFFNSKMYQTESELEISSSDADPNNPEDLATYLKINTIAKLPNQFWSEISLLSLDADYQPKITIISDGEKVWKIDHNNNQYLDTNVELFSEELDSLLLFSSQIYLLFWQGFYSGNNQMLEQFSQEELTKFMEVGITSMTLEMLLNNQADLRGSLQGEHYVYEYKDQNKDLQFKIFVDPQTAVVSKIELAAKEETLSLLIRENIASRIPNPSIEKDQFTFKPSSKVKKVDSLSVWDSFVSP
jgi:outer membrane lipoprotein-sorting protein